MNASLRYCVIALVSLTLTGCKATKVVEQVPVPVHDTTYIATVQHDSIHIDRWHTEYQSGDTIFITNEVTKYQLVTKTDTAIRYVERPVTVTRTETVEVKKPLAWWQKGLMWAGAVGIFIVLAAVAVRLRRR